MPVCAFCHANFHGDNPRQRYCSEQCRRSADNERRKDRRADAAELRTREEEERMAAYEAFMRDERKQFRSQCDSCRHRKKKNREMICAMCREGIKV